MAPNKDKTTAHHSHDFRCQVEYLHFRIWLTISVALQPADLDKIQLILRRLREIQS